MSTPKNSYVIPTEFLQWVTPLDVGADTVDDAVVADVLEATSRYCDSQTNRKFYPSVETQSYDVPSGRSLYLDDDLLEVLSITNGDDSSVSSTYYNLYPANIYPKDEIRLTETTSLYWASSSTTCFEQVIDVNAIWGYRERYSVNGWISGGTLGAAIGDTTTLAFTMTSGHDLDDGHIVRIDDELFVIKTVTTNKVTPFARGANGSTAATHSNSTAVYIWKPENDVEMATKQIAQNIYRRFAGSNASANENIVTASGVVITPRDVPVVAARTLARLRRIY
jgi:hypothetical protein